jgi:hypothetical protein
MRIKWLLVIVFPLLLALIAWHQAARFMIVRAIAPPNATASSLVATMLFPHYEMAAPHRSLYTVLTEALLPHVNACSPPICDGTTPKPRCPDNCSQGYCYCPGCQMSGCTPYFCTYVGGNRYCTQSIVISGNCEGCEADQNTKCQTCGAPPLPPCP